jgi:hypothetical protein
MLYLVDTVQTDPGRADEYLELLRSSGLPIMSAAGATLAWCSSTARELGEQVEILVVWAIGDHARWNEIRKSLVLDPRWHRYGRAAALLRRGGSRRFHDGTSFARAEG